MIWPIRSLTFVLLVSWISYGTIFGSWGTTTNGLAVSKVSRVLLREKNDSRISASWKLSNVSTTATSFLGSSQGQRVFKNRVDDPHQADVRLSTSRTTISSGISSRRIARKAVRNETNMWPNAEVPFIISMATSNNNEVKLNQAFEAFHQYTCIRFRPRREDDRDFVRFVNAFGCSSHLGRVEGPQELSLANFCSSPTVVLRNLGHLIGFHREISRPDRDDYVTIRLENIRSESLAYFEKLSVDMIDSKGIPYDYLSIMHDEPYTFSGNGQIVIETRNSSYQSLIGRSTCLSFRDAKLANIMYMCAERSGCDNISCPGEGFVGQDCRCWCPSQNRSVTAEPCAGLFTTTQGTTRTTTGAEKTLTTGLFTTTQGTTRTTTGAKNILTTDMLTTRQDDEINLLPNTIEPRSTTWNTMSLLPIGFAIVIVTFFAVTCF